MHPDALDWVKHSRKVVSQGRVAACSWQASELHFRKSLCVIVLECNAGKETMEGHSGTRCNTVTPRTREQRRGNKDGMTPCSPPSSRII